MSSWASQYVGIPYLENGYDRRGCSCWGLVRLVMVEQFGIVLPRHDQADIYNTEEFTSHYRQVDMDQIRPGDVLHLWGVANGVKTPTHAGVVVTPRQMLHTELNTGAIIESVTSKRAAWRLINAYRPEPNT